MERQVVERFENDDDKYLSWAEANPLGYILNVVKTDHNAPYPTVHAVRHALWTSKRESYVRADYIKVCSESLDELEHWAQGNYGRRLSHCRCTLQAQPSASSEGRDTATDFPTERQLRPEEEPPLRC